MIRIKKLFLCIIISIILIAPIFSNDQNPKTVRVGYMIMPHFQEGRKGEYKTGYGYEYLKLIANYTGWHYEYVYGSFEELYQKLLEGEIDLLGFISKTDEREKHINFGYIPQGRESFYIYALPNSEIPIHNTNKLPPTFTIGVRKNTYHELILSRWMEEINQQYKVVKYSTAKEMHDALERNEVDGILSSDFEAEEKCIPIMHLGFDFFYFGVNKNRTDLLNELNSALNKIFSITRFTNATLYTKYFGKSDENSKLNLSDLKWLKDNNNTIKIGYLRGNLPYAAQDQNGNLVGILAKLKEVFNKDYNINIEAKAYDTYLDMMKAADNREIDVIGPLFSDYYLSEVGSISNTYPLLSTTLVLLHSNPNLPEGELTMAHSPNNAIQYGLLKVLYPNSKIIEYPDKGACIKAVASGEVDCLLVSTAALNIYKQFKEFNDLNLTELDEYVPICLGVKEGRAELLNIVNRVITASQDRLSGASFVENAYIETTFFDILEEHSLTVIIVLFSIIIILISFILYYWRTTIKLIKMKNTNATLAYKIFKDELTGTFNRAGYLAQEDKFNYLISQNSEHDLGLVVIDINCLKQINDNFGHEKGDILIKNASNLICSIFKNSSVFRIGGDEFVVILKNEDFESWEDLTKKLTEISSRTISLSAVLNGEVSLSWGFAQFDKDNDSTLKDVFQRADYNMYIYKKEEKKNLNIQLSTTFRTSLKAWT